MALEKVKQLDTINKNITQHLKPSTPGNAGDYASYMVDNIYNSLYQTKYAANFKALDFSNVAIYGAKDHRTADEEKFRHFHQMRLYIDQGTTYHHTNSFGGKTVICCNLPEQIQYSLNSKWEAPLSFGDATFYLLMQMAGGSSAPSGTLRASTFKIWTNTEPLTLNLTIPVIDDGTSVSGTNLVEALEILGSLALPAYNQGGRFGFYVPPPSPLNIDIKYTKMIGENRRDEATFKMNTQNYSRIMLQLGGVLLIDHCIVESVSVQYPNTKAQIKHDYAGIEDFGMTGASYLHPLLAIVTLRISTVEALTADTYAKMLWARQNNQGSFTADTTALTELANDIYDMVTPESKNNKQQNQNEKPKS